MIRVVNVRGMKPGERAGVCYVGRRCAGWPDSEWRNPFKVGDPSPHNHRITIDREHALQLFRQHLDAMAEGGVLDGYLSRLWAACDRGRLSLGCWCVDATHRTRPGLAGVGIRPGSCTGAAIPEGEAVCDTELLAEVTDPTLTTSEAAAWVRELERQLRDVADAFHHRGRHDTRLAAAAAPPGRADRPDG